MARLWEDFKPVPERRGKRAKHLRFLRKKFQNGGYRYLYSFHDPEGESLKVIQIGDKTYVVDPDEKKFFKYRNPHYFVFFEPDQPELHQ